MTRKLFAFTYTPWWNLLLLTLSAFLVALSLKAIAIPHNLVSGGISGLSLILHYLSGNKLKMSYLFFVLNIPIFVLGYIYVSKRFFAYSLYGMIMTTIFLYFINLTLPIKDPLLSTIAYGSILGAGLGFSYRSLGSIGGTDIIAIILYNKFNLRIGQTNFFLNLFIFCWL